MILSKKMKIYNNLKKHVAMYLMKIKKATRFSGWLFYCQNQTYYKQTIFS